MLGFESPLDLARWALSVSCSLVIFGMALFCCWALLWSAIKLMEK